MKGLTFRIQKHHRIEIFNWYILFYYTLNCRSCNTSCSFWKLCFHVSKFELVQTMYADHVMTFNAVVVLYSNIAQHTVGILRLSPQKFRGTSKASNGMVYTTRNLPDFSSDLKALWWQLKIFGRQRLCHLIRNPRHLHAWWQSHQGDLELWKDPSQHWRDLKIISEKG